jgi:Na+-driven multidrug efflux pump
MQDEATIAFGQQYGYVFTTGLFPRYLYSRLTAYFATIDVVQSATITSLVGMALSVALNHLFIYGVGDSWSGFGFIGSPLATVVSSYYKYVQVVLLCF